MKNKENYKNNWPLERISLPFFCVSLVDAHVVCSY